jgi:chromosome partitioning protein
MKTLAIYFNKGGVGKTATAVNLAFLAAEEGFKTLVCDLDPQSSTTFYFRVKPKLKRRARGLVRWNQQIEQSIKGTDYPNLDLLPADFTHRNLDITFDRLKRRKHRLRMVLKPLVKEYDVVILDCPPTINILAENIFNAADSLLVPLIPTPLSMRTFQHLLEFLAETGHPPSKVRAFFSMVDVRKKIHREMMQTLGNSEANNFTGFLKTFIPYLSLVEQMGIYREPVVAFAPASGAALSYRELWREVSNSLFSES